MIPVFRPSTGSEEAAAVAEVLQSGWIGTGPKVAAFENALAAYLDAPYVVAVNSCTSALHLAGLVLGIGPGDEVIVPTLTFVSTAHAVCYCGARPVFADVEPDTLNICFDDVVRKLTPNTKAIVVVHHGGRPVDVKRLRALVGPKVALIEDCAHAAGATYYGKKAGTESDVACFSFHAVKNLAIGEGGALIVHTPQHDQAARALRWMGIDRSTWARAGSTYQWQYDVGRIGFNYQMTDISAAIGLVQLRRLEADNARRRNIVAQYDDMLHRIVEVPPALPAGFASSWHLYCVKVDHRDELFKFLASQGISTSVHYYPIHLYPCYGPQPALPVGEAAARRLLTLPLFPALTDAEVETIAAGIRQFVRQGAPA